MALIVVFLLLLILLFLALLYFLKPTSMEKAVDAQLASIDATPSNFRALATNILKEEAVQSGVLEDLTGWLPWSNSVRNLIRQCGKDWAFGVVKLTSLGAAAVVFWIVSLFNLPLAITAAAAVAAGLSPYLYLYILREIRFRAFGALLPEAVDLMARGLRAGHSISAALEMVGSEIAEPIGAEFRALQGEQNLGLPLRDSLRNLVNRVPIDDLRFLATAIMLQKESGGNLAQILDKTSAVIRERARLRGQLAIYTAQGRITGYILCGAPFLMFALISLVNHQYEKPLFTDPFGIKMLYFGLGMMVIGILAIRKIIDIEV
jgi:tight adherence protein B